MLVGALASEAMTLNPLEKAVVLYVMCAVLAWLPLRGMVALFVRKVARRHAKRRRLENDGCYHVGMKILPPM